MGSSRRVAVVLHEDIVGGASLAVFRILPLLEERGWEFVFWVPTPGPARSTLEERGYACGGEERLLRYSWGALSCDPGVAARLTSLPGYFRRFRRWLRAQEPALVHANTLLTIPELAAARPAAPPSLLYVHEFLGTGARDRAAARLARLTADTVLGNSAASVGALRDAGVDARLVHNGVALPHPVPARRRRDGRIVVGTLGMISKRKGSDLFLAAARAMRRALPEAEFRMVGPLVAGPERAWAERIVAAARSEGMTWTTSDDVFSELAEWDVLVMPSRVEPFGLAAAEAMAMGVPVVAAAVGGLPEVVTPRAGRLVPPDDVDALAAAILELARRPDLRDELGAAGRARAASAFSLERHAEAVHRAYLDTIAAGAARRRLRRPSGHGAEAVARSEPARGG